MSTLAFPIAVLLASSPAAPKPPAAVYPIETQCAAAAKLDDAHKQDAHFYADLSTGVRPGANDGSGNWRSFKNADELRTYAAKEGAPNTQASIWKAPDGTTIALLRFSSDSGDRSDDTDYCFRPDGTLARATSALVNFSAEAYGHRTLWFGADSSVLHKKEKASENGRRRKPGPDLMEGFDDTIVYPTVKSLPFLTPAAPPRPTSSKTPAKTPAAPP